MDIPNEVRSRGEIFTVINHPTTTAYGVRTHDGARVFVKTATREHRWSLDLAVAFHTRARRRTWWA